jgi:hypothetical protein
MRNSRLNRAVCAMFIAIAGNACSQGPVSIGNQQTTQAKTGLDAYAASWDGYVEAFNFTDNTDRVRITVSSNGTGVIRFGKEDLLPPASEPSAKYPPDYPNAGGVVGGTVLPIAWAGFLYSLNDVRVDTDRLRASAASKEIFRSWCGIQVPLTIATGVYSCLPCDWAGFGGDLDAGAGSDTCGAYVPCPSSDTFSGVYAFVPVICERVALCGTVNSGTGTCICDATGCSIGTPAQDIQLDAMLENNQQTMTGTLALGGTNYTVVLIRQ